MIEYMGYKLCGSYHLSRNIQVRFPRSKKRRIRRKWMKQSKNFKVVPDDNVYVMEQTRTLVAHPSVVARILKEMDNRFLEEVFKK